MQLSKSNESQFPVIWSATDLAHLGECEFGFLARLDEKHKRREPLTRGDDPLLKATKVLGDAHEARLLSRLEQEFGTHGTVPKGGVLSLRPPIGERVSLLSWLAARRRHSPQMPTSFFKPASRATTSWALPISCIARPAWRVADTKLAEKAKVPALLQTAAYADQISEMGHEVSENSRYIWAVERACATRLATSFPVPPATCPDQATDPRPAG